MSNGRKQGAKGNGQELAEKIAKARGLELKKPYTQYTEEQRTFLISNSYGHSYMEIQDLFSEKFGIVLTKNQISTFLKNRHLTTGKTGYFKPGRVPHNKGTHYCPSGSEKGWFKKGNIPHNHREVGSERITKDGYIEIKVAEPRTWKLKHRVVWEKEHGPVPDGYALVFKDHDKTNVDLSNLMMVKKAWNARVNQEGLSQVPANLMEAAYKYAELKSEIGLKRKKEKEC